ncbi:nucleotide sugar dehydrogenase [Tateyamaria omphalii]|uniref:Vi polysaccharide biosynthesis protein VipA/TviB n=1 Tax=Tateyamaria omphalii TaxID=299262 RepID=A0A1P8MY46_9RHOB|nr:nucleotide sugar dehydrogenase [Tateyamaria omphalii]APX12928.1 Vi polysaccharide biosynthesis protein VipA/TviB [Tateyamaria omphalii]
MIPAPLPTLDDMRVAVIGLGYVGLPLAVEFGKQRETIGFDLNAERVAELKAGTDSTGETDDLAAAAHLRYTGDLSDIADCNVYIVAVPTPIDSHRQPNLGPLLAAARMVGEVIARGDVVIFESTVYPGATEEDCLPLVEKMSGLTLNTDFYAGYSPERINPGDKERPLPKIIKVTSGSTPAAGRVIDALYGTIITAGTHLAPTIRVAEAAKVIENTQRDVNIALINELSIIFSHLGIDTTAVLDAAATKWNFNRYTPGLVGGHCIGVDPYYLIDKSISAGHIPDIIRMAREINDGMAQHAVSLLVKAMIHRQVRVHGGRALILGITFKPNCADIRNTKVVDMIGELQTYGMQIEIHDPWADGQQVHAEHGIGLLNALPNTGAYDAIVLAVPHDDLVAQGAGRLRALLVENGVLFDMKAVFGPEESDLRL